MKFAKDCDEMDQSWSGFVTNAVGHAMFGWRSSAGWPDLRRDDECRREVPWPLLPSPDFSGLPFVDLRALRDVPLNGTEEVDHEGHEDPRREEALPRRQYFEGNKRWTTKRLQWRSPPMIEPSSRPQAT